MSRVAWPLYPLVVLSSLLSALCFMGLLIGPKNGLDNSLIAAPFLVVGGGFALLLILLLVLGPSTPPTSTRMRGCALGGGIVGVALMMMPQVNMTILFLLYMLLGGRFSVVL